jgi:hypothetical protein
MPERESPAAGRADRAETFNNQINVSINSLSGAARQQPSRNLIERRLRRQYAVAAVHRLGPRVLDELLDVLGCHHGIAYDIGARLLRYAALDPAILRVVEGGRFPALPVQIVSSDL